MKKAYLLLFVLLLGMSSNGIAKSSFLTDFWTGKWELIVIGTPQGDAKFLAELVRKDGKLTGEISSPSDATNSKLPITKLEEKEDKIVINFSTQGYDVSLEFNKVDENNLKGTLMGMFEAKGSRLK